MPLYILVCEGQATSVPITSKKFKVADLLEGGELNKKEKNLISLCFHSHVLIVVCIR